MTYERRLAPSSAISGVEGVTTPGVMDKWRVQTEGYREGGRERYRRDWWLSEMVLKRMVTGNGLPEG